LKTTAYSEGGITVSAMAGLEPPPVASLMHSDAKTQIALPRLGGPGSNHVAARADLLAAFQT